MSNDLPFSLFAGKSGPPPTPCGPTRRGPWSDPRGTPHDPPAPPDVYTGQDGIGEGKGEGEHTHEEHHNQTGMYTTVTKAHITVRPVTRDPNAAEALVEVQKGNDGAKGVR